MNPHIRWSAVLASLALCALPLWAEETPEPAPTEEPEVSVIVTGERIEQPVSESISTATVITADDIRETGAQTVADALRLSPGVAVRQSGLPGSVANISIRGTAPSQTLVLVDGQRISNAAFIGGTDLSKFPVADVERIEVIRGPASSLYGSEAIGGVVNIITKRPEKAGGNINLGMGSNGRAERAVTATGTSPLLDWQLSGSFPAFDGTRPNSDYTAYDINGKVILPLVRGWEVTLHGGNNRDKLGLPGADYDGSGYADPDDRQRWQRSNLDLVAKRELGPGDFTWRGSLLRQQIDQATPGLDWMTYDPTVYNSLTTGNTGTLEASYDVTVGAHTLLFGSEYRNDRYQNSERQDGVTTSTQNKSIANRALYAQDRWEIIPQTNLVFGTRLDDHSTAGSKVTPRIGINREIMPGTFLRASYAEGFRAPTLVELYYNALGFSGNPDLKPETSKQYEIGMNWQFGKDGIDLALFRNRVREQITWLGTTYQNVSRARQQGAEVAWTHEFTPNTKLDMSYSYLDARDENTGERLLRQPYNKVTVMASTDLYGWNFGLSGSWQDAMLDIDGFDPNTWESIIASVPSRAIIDLTVERSGFKGLRHYVAIRNLTNEQYEELAGYPAEGRSIETGIRAAW